MSEIVDCIAYVVRKAFWSFWVFLKFVLLRICDLFGLVFNILACLTLLRFPVMIQQFLHMDSMWEWRFVGLIQVFIFITDIPFIIMAILMTVLTFGFVLIPFVRELREENVGLCDYCAPDCEDESTFQIFYDGFTLRRIIADYFFKTLCDLLCVPLAVICLCSWRCPIFVRKFKKSFNGWSDWKWRATAVVQFLQLLVDIPCLLLGLILGLTWRAPFLIRRAEDEEWNTYRLYVFPEACLLIIDLFCFVTLLFTIVTWRGPFLIYELYNAKKTQWEFRTIVFQQAGLVFVDIPCILCAIVVFGTLWRIRPFVSHLSKNVWKIRKNCIIQVAMLLVDLSCLIVGLVVVVTLWRLYPLVRDIKKYCRPTKRLPTENEPDKETAELREPTTQWSTIEARTTTSGESSDMEEEQGPAPVESQTSCEVTVRHDSGAEPDKKLKIQTWKIRKAIFKHFVFLFIDIPAIALCFFILVTVVRLPKLLSKLIQSGNFYMEFAITVYFQTGKLIVDMIFICLFVLLMLLRPIQSWVHLLEDEEHNKNRLLRFYLQFVPEIVEKRPQMYRELEEMFSICLKIRDNVQSTRYRLSLISVKYLDELQWIRDKLKKQDLDEEYDHMIHMVYWWEAKRAHKLTRLYNCELNYLAHPDVAVHNRNLLKYRSEMLQYERQVQQQYRQVEEFVLPKVPLWTDQTGLRTRTRKETQRVLIKCLPSGRFLITALILLNLLFIYRFPNLVRNLWGHWYNRRKIVFASTKEYLYDFVTLLRILIVLILIYRSPFLITDIIRDVFYIRSWRAVRETAKRYPPRILDDLAEMIKAVFSWKSVRFVVTALLFGLFMPAELFLTAIKLLGCNRCFAFISTAILYLFFVGFPFVLSFYLGRELLTLGYGSELNTIVGVFGGLLVAVLAVMAIALLRNPEESPAVNPKPYDYLRFNWSNMHVVVFEIVEYLQLLALVFTVADLPMLGAGVLHTASRYLLLNFATFEVKLWITFALFIVWFFCVGAPVIFEQILKNLPKGTCAKNIGWTLLVALLGNTFFVTVVESLISMVACNYNNCQAGNSTVNSSAVTCSGLHDAPSIECWRGDHRMIAFLGLFGLVWYATTSIIFGTKYGDVTHSGQDFAFSPVYNTFVDFAKALMVGVVVLAVSSTYLALITLLILNLLALIFTVVFEKVFAYPVSNSFGLSIWRSVGFLCGMVAAVTALVSKIISNPQSWIPLVILCAGTSVILLSALIFSLFKRVTTSTEEKRKTFRVTLLKLEQELVRKNQMVNSWSKQGKQWRRVVKNVYEAQSDNGRINQRAWQNIEGISPDEPPQLRVVAEGGTSEHFQPGAQDKQAPLLLQEGSTENLPPPPSYDELFPNIKGEYGVLPEPSSPWVSSPSLAPQQADGTVQTEEPLSGPQLREQADCIVQTEEPLSGPQLVEQADCKSHSPEKKHVPQTGDPGEGDSGRVQHSVGDEQKFEEMLGEDVHPTDVVTLGEHYNAAQIVEEYPARYCPEIPDELSRTDDHNPVTELECSGSNLLLLFEHHVHYSAFSFAFIAQLSIWRREVRQSSWVGLLHYVQALESNIVGTFNNPSHMDLMVGRESPEPVQEFRPDPDNEAPPAFAPEPHDPESIRAQSEAERSRALEDIDTVQNSSAQWVELLDKIIPTIPVIRRWVWDTDWSGESFEIHLRRPVQGTITDIGPRGIKLAKGAAIVLPKQIRGSFEGRGQKIKFAKGFEPKGKKGPINVTISELGIARVNSKLYVTAQDKRLAFDKALDSIHVLSWK